MDSRWRLPPPAANILHHLRYLPPAKFLQFSEPNATFAAPSHEYFLLCPSFFDRPD
jgi:hypothetical protein